MSGSKARLQATDAVENVPTKSGIRKRLPTPVSRSSVATIGPSQPRDPTVADDLWPLPASQGMLFIL